MAHEACGSTRVMAYGGLAPQPVEPPALPLSPPPGAAATAVDWVGAAVVAVAAAAVVAAAMDQGSGTLISSWTCAPLGCGGTKA